MKKDFLADTNVRQGPFPQFLVECILREQMPMLFKKLFGGLPVRRQRGQFVTSTSRPFWAKKNRPTPRAIVRFGCGPITPDGVLSAFLSFSFVTSTLQSHLNPCQANSISTHPISIQSGFRGDRVSNSWARRSIVDTYWTNRAIRRLLEVLQEPCCD